jgi:hypothetical protein
MVRVALGEKEKIPVLAQAVVLAGGSLYHLESKKDTLEELFIDLVQKGESTC